MHSTESVELTFNDSLRGFELAKEMVLLPGLCHIKFVINNEWILLPRQHCFLDIRGLVNNGFEVQRNGEVKYFEVGVILLRMKVH